MYKIVMLFIFYMNLNIEKPIKNDPKLGFLEIIHNDEFMIV